MSSLKYVTVVVIVPILFVLVQCKDIEFWNRRIPITWIGAHANKGFELPGKGGWKVRTNQKITIEVDDDWQGRFWTRTFCNLTDDNSCDTGGCGKNLECNGTLPTPPATTIEFRFNPDDFDRYSLSLVNGFNTKMTVSPVGPGGRNCKIASCTYPFIKKCPKELQREHADRWSGGIRISACETPCQKFKTDEYCCRGKYKGAKNCDPSKWPVDYTKIFKDKCPNAKTYAHDTTNAWHTCKTSKYSVVIEEGNPRN